MSGRSYPQCPVVVLPTKWPSAQSRDLAEGEQKRANLRAVEGFRELVKCATLYKCHRHSGIWQKVLASPPENSVILSSWRRQRPPHFSLLFLPTCRHVRWPVEQVTTCSSQWEQGQKRDHRDAQAFVPRSLPWVWSCDKHSRWSWKVRCRKPFRPCCLTQSLQGGDICTANSPWDLVYMAYPSFYACFPFLTLCVLTRVTAPEKGIALAGNFSLVGGLDGTGRDNDSVKAPSSTEISCAAYEELRLRLSAESLGPVRPTTLGAFPPGKRPGLGPLLTRRKAMLQWVPTKEYNTGECLY